MGYDYVFFMQKDRIEKIREKKRKKGILRPPGLGGVKNRLIHKSRRKVAEGRVRNNKGRFEGKKKEKVSETVSIVND